MGIVRKTFLTFFLFLGFCGTLLPSSQAQITEDSKVLLYGIGPVRAGMTVKEAEKVSGSSLVSVQEIMNDCTFMEPKGGPKGILFMVDTAKGVISRVDVGPSFPDKVIPKNRTSSGAGIGTREEKVQQLYQGKIKVERHPYGEASDHYLIFEPKDAADKKYLLIFETRKGKVERFRSGLKGPVQAIEGCS